MITVPSTIAAPAAFSVLFYTPALGFDLTTVTAVTFQMLRRDGTTATLTVTIVSKTPTELLAQYAFVGGEITTTGAYLLAPQLTVPGGWVPAETVTMMVTNPWYGSPKLQGQSWVVASALVAGTPYVPIWTRTPFGAELVHSGSPYAIPVGMTANAVNLNTGLISADVVNGSFDGETKRFISTSLTNPPSTSLFYIQSGSSNLYYAGNMGQPAASVSFESPFDVEMKWVLAANNGAGAWYL
jgi:hypothetical protein